MTTNTEPPLPRTSPQDPVRAPGKNPLGPKLRSPAGSREKPRKGEPRIRALGDLLNDDSIKPRQSLCGPWLLERGLSMVYAPTGVGKSWFAMAIAAAVAGGGSFGHWEASHPRTVLYIDGEMDRADLKTRFQSIVPATADALPSAITNNLLLYGRHDQHQDSAKFPDFGTRDDVERRRIIRTVQKYRPALVVLDNLSTLVTTDEENAAEAWDPFLSLLQELQAIGAAVLFVHHANKGGKDYRGSSKIPILLDAVVRLQRADGLQEKNGVAFVLDFSNKLRMRSEDAGKIFNINFTEDRGWTWDTLVDWEVENLVKRLRAAEFKTQKDAALALGKSPSDVSRMLKKAYEAGITTPKEIREALQEAGTAAEDHLDDF